MGETPIVLHRYAHDRISAISGIAVSLKRFHCTLYCQLYTDNIHSEEVAAFFRQLLRQLRGHVMVLLDNGKIHRGDPVQELLARTSRLHLVPFPAYTPEINPDEGVWNHIKTPWPTAVRILRPNSWTSCPMKSAASLLLSHYCADASSIPSFPLFCPDCCITYADINSSSMLLTGSVGFNSKMSMITIIFWPHPYAAKPLSGAVSSYDLT